MTTLRSLTRGIERRRMMRQGAWALTGQAASSLSNLLLMLTVARVATANDFGIFTLVITIHSLAVTGCRAVISTPLLMSVAGEETARVRQEVAGSISATLLSSIAMALPAILLGILLMPGLAGQLLIVLGLLLPVLLVQDSVRHAFMAEERAMASAACDMAWLILQVGCLVPMLLLGITSASAFTLAWGAAGACAGVGGFAALHLHISMRTGIEFVRRHRSLLPDLARDYVTVSVVTQSVPYVVAFAAGLAAAGSLRAGLVLLGVVNVVVMGMTPVAQLEATRIHKHAPHRDRTFVLVWATFVGVVSLAYAGALVAMPDSIGQELLGDSWKETRTLLLPLAICLLARSPYSAIQISLRARVLLRTAFRLRLFTAPSLIICAAFGAVMQGAVGAAWALAVAEFCISGCAAIVLRHMTTPQGTVAIHVPLVRPLRPGSPESSRGRQFI